MVQVRYTNCVQELIARGADVSDRTRILAVCCQILCLAVIGVCCSVQICSVQLQSVDGSAMKNVSMKIVAPSLKSAQLTKHNGSLC